MTASVTLPARLDLTAAKALARDLADIKGDMVLDASGVTHLGGLCLQILLATSRHCAGSGRGFEIEGGSAEFGDALGLFGVDPTLLQGKVAE